MNEFLIMCNYENLRDFQLFPSGYCIIKDKFLLLENFNHFKILKKIWNEILAIGFYTVTVSANVVNYIGRKNII